MTVQRLSLDAVLTRPLAFLSCPPALRFYVTHGLAVLASLMVVAWAVWDARTGVELLHWVCLLFGGTVLLLSLWPASWSRQRLINLAFDEQQLYLVNGLSQQAVALPRERVRAVNKDKLPGHDGAIIAFTLDLRLSDAELVLVQDTLDAQVEDRFKLDDDGYRFGFVGNWQNRRRLLAAISVLAPAVVAPAVTADEDEDDWD